MFLSLIILIIVRTHLRQGNGNIIVWSENESFGREEFDPQQWEEFGVTIVARVVKIIKSVWVMREV